METVVLVIHSLVAVSIVALILLQQGKGADAGASFGGGGGASNTVFGSLGAAPFLTKLTAILAVVFFMTSLGLAVLANNAAKKTFVIDVPAALSVDVPNTQFDEALESDLPTLNVEKSETVDDSMLSGGVE